MRDLNDKVKAQQLRTKGMSYNEISSKLSISKSTLHYWLRDVKLTPKQKDRLTTKVRKATVKANKKRGGNKAPKRKLSKEQRKVISKRTSELNRRRYESKRKDLLDKYRSQIPTNFFELDDHSLALVGAALYWAEGTKEGLFRFSNSDPYTIQIFLKWARHTLNVKEDEFRCLVQVYLDNGLSYEEIEAYWIKLTGIPAKNFYKPGIKKPKETARTKLIYGTITVQANTGMKYLAKYYALAEALGKKDVEEQFVYRYDKRSS